MDRKLHLSRENSEKFLKSSWDIHIEVEQEDRTILLNKLNPNDVYGSMGGNEERK